MSTSNVRNLGEPPLAAIKEEPAGTAALDELPARWTQEEADTFSAAIAPLEQVDPELWA
jgi:hypothetical protein